MLNRKHSLISVIRAPHQKNRLLLTGLLNLNIDDALRIGRYFGKYHKNHQNIK